MLPSCFSAVSPIRPVLAAVQEQRSSENTRILRVFSTSETIRYHVRRFRSAVGVKSNSDPKQKARVAQMQNRNPFVALMTTSLAGCLSSGYSSSRRKQQRVMPTLAGARVSKTATDCFDYVAAGAAARSRNAYLICANEIDSPRVLSCVHLRFSSWQLLLPLLGSASG